MPLNYSWVSLQPQVEVEVESQSRLPHSLSSSSLLSPPRPQLSNAPRNALTSPLDFRRPSRPDGPDGARTAAFVRRSVTPPRISASREAGAAGCSGVSTRVPGLGLGRAAGGLGRAGRCHLVPVPVSWGGGGGGGGVGLPHSDGSGLCLAGHTLGFWPFGGGGLFNRLVGSVGWGFCRTGGEGGVRVRLGARRARLGSEAGAVNTSSSLGLWPRPRLREMVVWTPLLSAPRPRCRCCCWRRRVSRRRASRSARLACCTNCSGTAIAPGCSNIYCIALRLTDGIVSTSHQQFLLLQN